MKSLEMADTASPNGLAMFRAITLNPVFGVTPLGARIRPVSVPAIAKNVSAG